MALPNKIVPKITDDIDRKEVLCTTYQMRNCFQQFYDGVASELDVHCYFQHAFAADLMPDHGRVLDVCCGRGLLIPFLRYRSKTCRSYVGVDIHRKNAVFARGLDPRRSTELKEWGFPVSFVEANVAEMSQHLSERFDLVVYTSAIEHMAIEAQQASLRECRAVATDGAILYLTCPVTQEDASGYNAQYAAHVYEPKKTELCLWLKNAGWLIKKTIGLSTKCRHLRTVLSGESLQKAEMLLKIMPREQALPTIAALYPECALEVAIICQ